MVRARMTDYGAERLEHDFEERVDHRLTDLRLSNYDASDDSATREKTDFLNEARCPDRLEMTGLSDREREAVHGRLRETIDDRTAPNDVEARLGFAQAAAERLTDEDADPNWTEAYIYGLRHGEAPKTLDFYYQAAHEPIDWDTLRELHFGDEAGQSTFVDSFVNSWASELHDAARGNRAATAEANRAIEFFKEKFNNDGIPGSDSPEWTQITDMQDYFLQLGHGVEFNHGHLEDYHPPDIPPDISPESVNHYLQQVTHSLGDHWTAERNDPYDDPLRAQLARQLEHTHREAVIVGLVADLERSNSEWQSISQNTDLHTPAQQAEARRDTTMALNAVAHAIRPA